MIFHMVDVVWCRLLRTGVFRGKVAEREVAGSYPGQTNTHGVFCYDFYKRLDIRVFSDKDEKPKAPFHSSFTVLIFLGRKRTDTAVRKE